MMRTSARVPTSFARWAMVVVLLAAFASADVLGPTAAAAPSMNAPAPAFSVKTADGVERSLSDYAGKIVVLEWTNHDCPYVRKHYGTGNMQRLQKQAAADGIVWLTVISSAPGEQGYVDGDEAKQIAAEAGAAPAEILLDPEGTMGRAYGAKTTPHMYVIDREGHLVYMGGIDDRPTTKPGDVQGAENYVAAALADLAAGRPVRTASSRPYGCSIKYRSS
jgi:peroxiredoxin